MATKASRLKQNPVWARGPASIDAGEVVLDPRTVEIYPEYELAHRQTLVPDLANLRSGDPKVVEAFANRHGLLWHGPDEIRKGECRESLHDWVVAGSELSITILLYVALKDGLERESAKPVREFLRRYRDTPVFWAKIPDDDEKCLEYASIQLAERITRDLEGCEWTLSAACGLVRDGEKEGKAGDFRFGADPPNLVAAANNHFASLIVTRAEFRECAGCGQPFQPDHGRQIYHQKNCSNRTRQYRHRYG